MLLRQQKYSDVEENAYVSAVTPDVLRGTRILAAVTALLTSATTLLLLLNWGPTVSRVSLASNLAMILASVLLLAQSRGSTGIRAAQAQSVFLFATVCAGNLISAAYAVRHTGRVVALEIAGLTALYSMFLPLRFGPRFVLFIVPTALVSVLRARLLGIDPVFSLVAGSGTVTMWWIVVLVHDKILRQTFHTSRKLKEEQTRSDALLRNIYPLPIYEKIRNQAQPHFVQRFADVSVLFADIVGFTRFAAERPPEEVVEVLNQLTSRLDATCQQLGAVKIKTIGDAYMATTGLPDGNPEHPLQIADLALEFREAVRKFSLLNGYELRMRIGIHSGSVVAGIIGRQTSHFDLWGDTVNLASRLESAGVADGIHVSAALADRLRVRYLLREREPVELKGYGAQTTYILDRPIVAGAVTVTGEQGLVPPPTAA